MIFCLTKFYCNLCLKNFFLHIFTFKIALRTIHKCVLYTPKYCSVSFLWEKKNYFVGTSFSSYMVKIEANSNPWQFIIGIQYCIKAFNFTSLVNYLHVCKKSLCWNQMLLMEVNKENTRKSFGSFTCYLFLCQDFMYIFVLFLLTGSIWWNK